MHLFQTLVAAVFLSLNLSGVVPYERIEAAFKSKNSKDLVELAKDKLLMNVLGKENVYSQSQAALILKDFFAAHPEGNFAFVFKGKETQEGSFAIGNYTCDDAKYRITIHFTKIGDIFKIESLTIE